jgi:hypothetical protein
VTTTKDLESRVAHLEGKIPPAEQFADVIAEALSWIDDSQILVVDGPEDSVGPLGGKSKQVRGLFTDAKGKRHGFIMNCYVGAQGGITYEDDEEEQSKLRVFGKNQHQGMERK